LYLIYVLLRFEIETVRYHYYHWILSCFMSSIRPIMNNETDNQTNNQPQPALTAVPPIAIPPRPPITIPPRPEINSDSDDNGDGIEVETHREGDDLLNALCSLKKI
jgi:hypothetical protein